MRSRGTVPAGRLVWLAGGGLAARSGVGAPARVRVPAEGDVAGTVVDSVSGTPLAGGEVRVSRGGRLVASTTTDGFGRYAGHNLSDGAYTVAARYLGFRATTRDVTVQSGRPVAPTAPHSA